MIWDESAEKAERERREQERAQLLALSDFEAEQLSVPERYQRMRYQREVEATQFVERNKPLTMSRGPQMKTKTVWNHD